MALICVAMLATGCVIAPPPPMGQQFSEAGAMSPFGPAMGGPSQPMASRGMPGSPYQTMPSNPYRPEGGPYGATAGESYGQAANPYGQRPSSGGPFIYPDKGQTPQQEENDKGQCYTWAVQQSSFDPANPPPPNAPPPSFGPPQGGMFRGAAGGAALGAIGGAIGGNAGKGAAMGAAMGGVFGGMRRREFVEQEQSQQRAYVAQQQNVLDQGRAAYQRAFGACMTGRGYTVS